MIPYYFAPPELRFWVAGGCSLDFLFRFASRQNEKTERLVKKSNVKIQLLIRIICCVNFYEIKIHLSILKKQEMKK
ncbi:hypothetical protein HMPREF9455_03763 [Dysgonomonas gadei ATCC BAA-286]|uniref:Uncharacterized protein n=1 Tax=Dysgonomonas gadei ATCC BAA-286 TaxID=742766 RepID=F5J346_9BACT|nr:hypothetical protein HMPREF9455_03763 [Dysgonomonas gadei ATCC BAA-286]